MQRTHPNREKAGFIAKNFDEWVKEFEDLSPDRYCSEGEKNPQLAPVGGCPVLCYRFIPDSEWESFMKTMKAPIPDWILNDRFFRNTKNESNIQDSRGWPG